MIYPKRRITGLSIFGIGLYLLMGMAIPVYMGRVGAKTLYCQLVEFNDPIRALVYLTIIAFGALMPWLMLLLTRRCSDLEPIANSEIVTFESRGDFLTVRLHNGKKRVFCGLLCDMKDLREQLNLQIVPGVLSRIEGCLYSGSEIRLQKGLGCVVTASAILASYQGLRGDWGIALVTLLLLGAEVFWRLRMGVAGIEHVGCRMSNGEILKWTDLSGIYIGNVTVFLFGTRRVVVSDSSCSDRWLWARVAKKFSRAPIWMIGEGLGAKVLGLQESVLTGRDSNPWVDREGRLIESSDNVEGAADPVAARMASSIFLGSWRGLGLKIGGRLWVHH